MRATIVFMGLGLYMPKLSNTGKSIHNDMEAGVMLESRVGHSGLLCKWPLGFGDAGATPCLIGVLISDLLRFLSLPDPPSKGSCHGTRGFTIESRHAKAALPGRETILIWPTLWGGSDLLLLLPGARTRRISM